MDNKKNKPKFEQNRQRILDAASELFLSGGLSALSVRAIATQAGVSTIGIYSHFDGKQGILDALYIEGFERVIQIMDVDTAGLNKEQQLQQYCHAYLDVAEQFSAHYALIFGAANEVYQPSEEAHAVAVQAFKTLLNLTKAMNQAPISDSQLRQKALQIWAVLHGFVELQKHETAQAIDFDGWRELAISSVLTLLLG